MNIFRWFLANGVFGACIYLGLYHGIDGARNVALFWAWFGFVISIAAMQDAVIDSLRQKINNNEWLMPRHIDVIFDLACVCAFVWYGHLFTGIAYLIHIFCLAHAWDEAKKPAENSENMQA